MTEATDQKAPPPTAPQLTSAVAATWEQRQKHAGFYQTQVSAIQQAALAFNTTGTLVITLAVAMSKMSGVTEGSDWAAVFIGVVGWLALTVLLTGGHSRSAERVRNAYLLEHAQLFPSTEPYRLESYLLKYPGHKARRRESATTKTSSTSIDTPALGKMRR